MAVSAYVNRFPGEVHRKLRLGPVLLTLSTEEGPVDVYGKRHPGSVELRVEIDGAWRVR